MLTSLLLAAMVYVSPVYFVPNIVPSTDRALCAQKACVDVRESCNGDPILTRNYLSRVYGKTKGLHRASYEIHYGPIPEGKWVLHKCDVPACVNPEHLFVGTHDDNMRDAREKGRTASGERNGQAKLSGSQIDEIRALRRSGLRLLEIGNRFGVSFGHVSAIAHGNVWEEKED